ncbi:MAG: preprotein translocase subunit SecY [Cytophagales bacterium]|jgi:preprotein translocase subunit SecY|nr:preprotein translocase subunit SecY [Cytophagales bacterium]MCA6366701.1 preprotein translocase subunit SecY [Cytophagales bacterium]MCA6372714.1 preprotein translocase subunit SecY [Cytophagales bacterium]MCA6377570.1 preprotein translocase subunit SecY [Cytophagales bacterium]MCA6384737.1 preprotein translocase subunit SecY [Cytophagales bacterium]
MKRFFTTIKNIFAIEDLRVRILNTMGFLIIFRLGSYIVLPGIDPNLLTGNQGGIFDFLNTFLGGSFSRASIFALGIMPYISASIVVQLLTVAVPHFAKMQKEGDSGRKKLNQFTRVLTILITAAQSYGYLRATVNQEAIINPGLFFTISSMMIIVAGTMFCMWLGERITDKGIGNGISMLIMIGIVSRFPAAIYQEADTKGLSGGLLLIIEALALFFVVVGVIAMTQAVRRIPVQYAKQVVGNKLYGGKRDFIPLKLNSAGVMPIIFAQALMFIPPLVAQIWRDSDVSAYVGTTFADFTSWQYNLLFASLIIIFTFFYTAITVPSNDIAENLKRNGGFVPGIKPGKQTAEFIDSILSKITLPGALLLAAVAVLPAFAVKAGITQNFAYFYGGTSLLILVGVVLDTLQQIESYLLMRHYEGMMKSGRVKGRSQFAAA